MTTTAALPFPPGGGLEKAAWEAAREAAGSGLALIHRNKHTHALHLLKSIH